MILVATLFNKIEFLNWGIIWRIKISFLRKDSLSYSRKAGTPSKGKYDRYFRISITVFQKYLPISYHHLCFWSGLWWIYRMVQSIVKPDVAVNNFWDLPKPTSRIICLCKFFTNVNRFHQFMWNLWNAFPLHDRIEYKEMQLTFLLLPF